LSPPLVSLLFALLVLLFLVPAAHAGIADSLAPNLTGASRNTTKVIYSVTGVYNNAGLGTYFSGTNVSTSTITLGVEVFGPVGGGPVNNAYGTTPFRGRTTPSIQQYLTIGQPEGRFSTLFSPFRRLNCLDKPSHPPCASAPRTCCPSRRLRTLPVCGRKAAGWERSATRTGGRRRLEGARLAEASSLNRPFGPAEMTG